MGLDDNSHCDSPKRRSSSQCPDAIMRESFNTGGYVERRQEFDNGGHSKKKKRSTWDTAKDTIAAFAPLVVPGVVAYGGNKIYNKYKNSVSPETRTKLENTYNTVRDGISKVDNYRKNPQDLLKDAVDHFAPKQAARDSMSNSIDLSLANKAKALKDDRNSADAFAYELQKNLQRKQFDTGGSVPTAMIREQITVIPKNRDSMPFGIDPSLANNVSKKQAAGDYSGMGRNDAIKIIAKKQKASGVRGTTPEMDSTIRKANARRNAGTSGIYNEIGSENSDLPRHEQIDKFYESKRPGVSKRSPFAKDDFAMGMKARHMPMALTFEKEIIEKPRSKSNGFEERILNPKQHHGKINTYKRHK